MDVLHRRDLDVTQWLRECTVTVGQRLMEGNVDTGLATGYKITGNRIVFTIEQTLRGPPNTLNLKVYNLSPDNEAKIRKEFHDVKVDCGYRGKSSIAFWGNIKHAFRYRDGNDWITEIQAADGDKDYQHARVSISLAAGTSPVEALDQVLKSMPNTRKGFASVSQKLYSRGKTLIGTVSNALDQLSRDNGASWSILNGVLEIVRADEVIPRRAVVVNASTGMLGAPEINDKGITVKMFLNPFVQPNRTIFLDNNDIKIKALQLYQGGAKIRAKRLVRLSPDGTYKVYKVRHEGDTRGNDWFTEATCVALGDRIPKGSQ